MSKRKKAGAGATEDVTKLSLDGGEVFGDIKTELLEAKNIQLAGAPLIAPTCKTEVINAEFDFLVGGMPDTKLTLPITIITDLASGIATKMITIPGFATLYSFGTISLLGWPAGTEPSYFQVGMTTGSSDNRASWVSIEVNGGGFASINIYFEGGEWIEGTNTYRGTTLLYK